MAFTKVKEKHKGLSYKGTQTAREHTREFVITSSTDVTAYAARLASDGVTTLPLVGDTHPEDSGAKCISVDIEKRNDASPEGLYHFDAKCQYSSDTRMVTVATSPLLRPWEYSGVTDTNTEDYAKDNTPSTVKFCTNSAGEPFDTLPSRLAKGQSITITRNQASSPQPLLDVYDKTSNSGTVAINGYTHPAKSLLMESINWRKVTEDAVDYYTVTFTMKVRNGDWHDRVLDIGYSQKDGAGSRKPILDAGNKQVTKPWPLDGLGAKKPNATDAPAEIDLIPYAEISWAPLSFV